MQNKIISLHLPRSLYKQIKAAKTKDHEYNEHIVDIASENNRSQPFSDQAYLRYIIEKHLKEV